MGTFDFNTPVNRVGTDSTKWGALTRLGIPDAVPMWVADMDFQSPPAIVEALTNRATHGVYGYGVSPEGVLNQICNWVSRRHGWEIAEEAIVFSPGVLAALSFLIAGHTQPGDGVIIQTPVYHPFARIIQNLGREVVINPLKQDESGSYQMDFEDLRTKAKDAKFLILCSPHNPVGRVWTREELEQVAEICADEGVFVASDEIHADLVYKGSKHIPFLSVSSRIHSQAVVLMAPTKTFNIAGLHASYAVAVDEQLRKDFADSLFHYHVSSLDIFANLALYTAYNEGEPWLEELLAYLEGNVDEVLRRVEEIKGIKAARPEGTYLMWLDCRDLGLSDDDLEEFLNHKAGVYVNQGKMFGEGGNGFIRMNIGCPRSQVVDAMERIASAAATLVK